MAYRKSLLPSYVQGSHNKNLKPVVMKAKASCGGIELQSL